MYKNVINYLSKLTIYYNYPYLYSKLSNKNNYEWNKLNNQILRKMVEVSNRNVRVEEKIDEALDYLENGIFDQNTVRRNIILASIRDIVLEDINRF